MVIYADVIFAANFVSSYILLYILGKIINKTAVRKKRLAAASLIGAVCAAVVFCTKIPVCAAYIIRAGSVFLMIFTAFFELRKRLPEQLAWFALMTGMMMFAMITFVSVIKSTAVSAVKAGVVYFNIPPLIFLVTLSVSYPAMIFFVKMFKNRKNKRYYIMNVTHNDKKVTVSALFDSGNLLREPITGKCVSILEWSEAKKLFEADFEYSELQNHAEDMKLWVIPFNSLGNQSGMIFAFLADSIDIPEEKKKIDKSFIGIYEGRLSQNEEYRALLNAGLL